MIGSRIISLRKSHRMSQQQLADALHISASSIGMYEQGRRIPNVDVLVALSEVFDVSIDFLVTGHEHIYKTPTPPEDIPQTLKCPCGQCEITIHCRSK